MVGFWFASICSFADGANLRTIGQSTTTSNSTDPFSRPSASDDVIAFLQIVGCICCIVFFLWLIGCCEDVSTKGGTSAEYRAECRQAARGKGPKAMSDNNSHEHRVNCRRAAGNQGPYADM